MVPSLVPSRIAKSVEQSDRDNCTREVGFFGKGVAVMQGEHHKSIRVNRVRALAAVLMLWSTTAWGATLTWNANGEADLGGYHVYHCGQQPCAKSSGTATLLATLGKVTSFNIGTPAVTQYYAVTAYDLANNESSLSNVVTYLPAAASSPPSAATVSLTVLGSPNLNQPWTVQATTNASGTVSVQFWINGALTHTGNNSPYCAFGDTSGSCVRVQKPAGYYTVEARVLSNGIEVARQVIVANATGVPFPTTTVSLTVLGSPDLNQPWAVQATTNASGSVSMPVRINSALDHIEHYSLWCAFGDAGGPCNRFQEPPGYYTIEFRVLSNGIEVARQAIVVRAT